MKLISWIWTNRKLSATDLTGVSGSLVDLNLTVEINDEVGRSLLCCCLVIVNIYNLLTMW